MYICLDWCFSGIYWSFGASEWQPQVPRAALWVMIPELLAAACFTTQRLSSLRENLGQCCFVLIRGSLYSLSLGKAIFLAGGNTDFSGTLESVLGLNSSSPAA